MAMASVYFRYGVLLRWAVVVGCGLLAVLGGPLRAEQKPAPTGPVHFFLWNNGPGQTFDPALWASATATLQAQGFDAVSIFSDHPGRIPALLNAANNAEPRETVIVLTTAQVATADAAVFADRMAAWDATMDGNPDLAGSAVFIDAPLCRVMQPPLKSTEYAPSGMVITGTDPDATRDCYRALAMLHSRRAQGWDLDADGNRIVATDPTAGRAQDAMPPAKSLGWLLVDTTDPDRRKKRANAIFAPGEEIVIRTTLDYIRKRGAGALGARFDITLDVEIKSAGGALLKRADDLYRYEGKLRHRVPVDAEYFRNWIVASVKLQEPGAYQVVFLLTDRMAPADKQIPVPITVDVTVE